MAKVNAVQELVFQIMEASSFNRFHGAEVAQSLRDCLNNVWQAVWFCGEDAAGHGLILRDLEYGRVNAGTLYILAQRDNFGLLMALIKTWGADEVSWGARSDGEEGGNVSWGENDKAIASRCVGPRNVLVRVWWD